MGYQLLTYATDIHAFNSGTGLDARCFGLEIYEPLIATAGAICRRKGQEMVVGREQLEGPGGCCEQGQGLKPLQQDTREDESDVQLANMSMELEILS